MKREKNFFFHSRNELKRNLKESERHWPSQSKMKVSTESMSSSAFFKGWAAADALVVKFSILVLHFLLKFKFLFHVVQFVKLWEGPFRPKNLGIVGFTLHKIRDGDVEEEEETADTETTVLLSISVSVLCYLSFLFCSGKKIIKSFELQLSERVVSLWPLWFWRVVWVRMCFWALEVRMTWGFGWMDFVHHPICGQMSLSIIFFRLSWKFYLGNTSLNVLMWGSIIF